jgi:hypothetical protein
LSVIYQKHSKKSFEIIISVRQDTKIRFIINRQKNNRPQIVRLEIL